MKCLSAVVLLIGITFGIVSVSSRNIDSIENCNTKGWELIDEFNSCAPRNFRALEFIKIIKAYKNQTINSTIFSEVITNFCATLKAANTCSFEKMGSIQPKCRHTPLTERFVNLLRIVARLETDFCSEQILYNVANDSGFNCLSNSSVTNCRHPEPVVAKSEFSVDDTNICATMKRYQACGVDIFDECQGDGQIKKYVEQAFNSLNDEFSCSVVHV